MEVRSGKAKDRVSDAQLVLQLAPEEARTGLQRDEVLALREHFARSPSAPDAAAALARLEEWLRPPQAAAAAAPRPAAEPARVQTPFGVGLVRGCRGGRGLLGG
jgi:hypothetical protein